MATSGESPPPAAPHAPAPDVALPPLPPPATREGAGQRFVAAALAALVVLTAFLLASFPARNSDVWMHLATGRALTAGDCAFGEDPFAHTTAGAYWVNHAWLYDVLAHGLYRLAGGAGLVLVKALLIAALSAVLLLTARRRADPWLAATCVALAVLAQGPYLALRPAVLSYLLLGLTLAWLERTAGEDPPRRPLAFCAPLLVLFALWVNLDEWFLLGPTVVGLWGLGALLWRRGGDARLLGLAFAAGLAVCLLNPHTFRAFTLPAALAPASPVDDLPGRDRLVSPFQPAYFTAGPGLTPAGLAYFALVLLGVLSFAVNPGGRRRPRALVWLALLVLSAYRSGAVPFFAVVAGPVAAINLGEAARRAAAAPGSGGRRGRAAPRLALVALAALAAAAWPGWLQGFPPEPRRWAVETDPSLEGLAPQFARWHREGILGEGARGFNFSPAAANYLAWFCPTEKGFFDGRPHLFPAAVAAEFTAVRQGLTRQAAGAPGAGAWRDVLRKAGVTHVILNDPPPGRAVAALRTAFSSPREWGLLGLHGRAVIFAWRDRRAAPSAVAVPALDPDREAMHPPLEKRAPPAWPGRDPEPRPWWHAFTTPRPLPTAGGEEAFVHITRFEALFPAYFYRADALLAAGLVGSVPGGPGGLSLAPAVPFLVLAVRPERPRAESRPANLGQAVGEFRLRYAARRDDGPLPALLAAVRAARRALHANPDDAFAHLMLGEAYLRLLRNTRERGAAAANFPVLQRLRRVQAVTALENAARLWPDSLQAHQQLARLYLEDRQLDLALPHLERELRQTRAAGPLPGETAAQFSQRVGTLANLRESVAREVRQKLNRYETEAFNLGALGRAQAAQAAGLPGKALDVLVHARYEEFGIEGARLELELLLTAGRVKEVRTWMDPDQEKNMGRGDYRWFQAQLGAATGDYAQAVRDLQLLRVPALNLPDFGLKGVPLRTAACLAAGDVLLAGGPAGPLQFRAGGAARLRFTDMLVRSLRRQAEIAALEGLLALEWGESDRAEGLFRESLALWRVAGDGPTALARHYLRLLTAPAAKGGSAGARLRAP